MMVKSCKALGVLPAVDGVRLRRLSSHSAACFLTENGTSQHASWIPVNRAAKVMTELLFNAPSSRVLHMENPARQSWSDILAVLSSSLSISTSLPYGEWLEKVKSNPDAKTNPCVKIMPFLEEEFIRMATGVVVLDTKEAEKLSPTLESSQPVGEELVRKYVEFWRKEEFLV